MSSLDNGKWKAVVASEKQQEGEDRGQHQTDDQHALGTADGLGLLGPDVQVEDQEADAGAEVVAEGPDQRQQHQLAQRGADHGRVVFEADNGSFK